MAGAERRPSFYAARGGGWRDWWTLLHPPYTLWHLSYVAIGAGLAPRFDVGRLIATLVAFFLALGIAAHALDELNGRPLGTRIPGRVLVGAAVASLAAAAAIGFVMLFRIAAGPAFVVSGLAGIAVGVVLVVAYSLELLGGRVHTDTGFAAAWGAFPVLAAYFAQAERFTVVAVIAAAAAFAVSWAQRTLSTPARFVRRNTEGVEVAAHHVDGSVTHLGEEFILEPLEAALRALTWAMALLATALVVTRVVFG